MNAVRLSRLRRRLGASLWFWPAVVAIAAFVGARLLVRVDRHLAWEHDAWYLFGGSASGARELLSTISSSMMTFTALVFSITILVLQLASGQFSPRVLRTFLADRHTQVAMSAFVGTFVYALALLPIIRGDADGHAGFVPGLSLFVAFSLVLASLGVFIRYIDHMAHAIRAVTIIKRVADDTRAAMEDLYPDPLLDDDDDDDEAPPAGAPVIVTHAGRAGVLAAVDEDGLLEVACSLGAIVALVPAPGEFVPEGAPLLRCWGCDAGAAERLRGAISIEAERTPEQDPAFGFRQLVDIAERALSPGVNDPSTAVQTLDELHDLLRRLATRRYPTSRRVDRGGELRLILPRPSWQDHVRLALDEITHYGGGSLQVTRRIRALLDDLAAVAPPARRAALDEQRALLEEVVARRFESPRERAHAIRPTRASP